jgi:hypothetical protein
MNPQTIAREWWILVVALLTGFVVVPIVVPMALTRSLTGAEAGMAEFYHALRDPRQALVVWGIAFAPYVLTQLARSVMWAASILNKERQ